MGGNMRLQFSKVNFSKDRALVINRIAAPRWGLKSVDLQQYMRFNSGLTKYNRDIYRILDIALGMVSKDLARRLAGPQGGRTCPPNIGLAPTAKTFRARSIRTFIAPCWGCSKPPCDAMPTSRRFGVSAKRSLMPRPTGYRAISRLICRANSE